MTEALFLGFGVLLVASSLMMVVHKNPVTSALFLVLAFCSLAGIYLMLHAEFLGMVQIIVYAGAIMVLFLFVIMYLNLGTDVETGVQIALRRGLGWVIGGLVVTFGILLIAKQWVAEPAPERAVATIGNTQAIGQLLYTRYLFPFEITSVILLVAIMGAVVIAKGRAPLGRSESMASRNAPAIERRGAAAPKGGPLDVITLDAAGAAPGSAQRAARRFEPAASDEGGAS